MKRVLLTLVFLLAPLSSARAADPCYAVPQGYSGQAVCQSAYTTCIQNRPADAVGCQNAAQQIGQATYNNGLCGATGTNQCPDVPEGFVTFINTPKAAPAPQTSTPIQTGAPSVSTPNSNGNLPYTPLEPLPGVDTGALQQGRPVFGALMTEMFRIAIYLGGMAAVVAFILAGISYMVSDIVDKKAEARDRMRSAAVGLVIILGSWLILNTINPQLTNFSSLLTPVISPTNAPSTLDAVTPSDIADCTNQPGTHSLHTLPNGQTVCLAG